MFVNQTQVGADLGTFCCNVSYIAKLNISGKSDCNKNFT